MNGRIKLTQISRATGLPVSTIHERLRTYQSKGYVRPICLIDFEKLGFGSRAHVLMDVEQKDKEVLLQFLSIHPNVNTLFRINNGWTLLMECVFPSMIRLEEFLEGIGRRYIILKKEVHYTLKEIKREGFEAFQQVQQAKRL